MAIYSGIFNSQNGDRKYNAWWFAKYFSTFIGNGIFPNPSTNLQVVEGSNMKVIVKSGSGWINGYFLYSDSEFVLELDNADGVLKRIDRVVMRLNYLTRQIEVVVKKGTFASNPTAPTLQRDADYFELALADILITNGATQITQANITDTRLNSSLCGIVHGTVEQVDTTTIFNQYESWFNEFSVEKQKEFEQWMEDLIALLDGDVATNLLNRIINLESKVDVLDEKVNAHLGERATTTTKGHVQLSNDTNSTSETLAPTMKALNEVKQYASEGKTAIANAVNEKGVSASPNDTFPTLATKIGQINTGKRFATGVATPTSTQYPRFKISVRGLDFIPSIIITRSTFRNTSVSIEKYFSVYWNDPSLNLLSSVFNGDTQNPYDAEVLFVNGGFDIYSGAYSQFYTDVKWIAIE